MDNDEELAAANTRTAIAGKKVDKKKKASMDKSDRITLKTFLDFIGRRKNSLILIGCCGAWFFQDIAYFTAISSASVFILTSLAVFVSNSTSGLLDLICGPD